MATIELFGGAQIKEMLKQDLQAYYQFHHEDTTDLDEIELRERELQAQTALDSFLAMLASRPQFQNEECASEYLSSATCGGDTNILTTFSAWVEESMQEYKPQAGCISLTATTPQDLNYRLEPWVTTNPLGDDGAYSKTPSWWPIVRVVRVGMHSVLLERGIIVADLPGKSFYSRR